MIGLAARPVDSEVKRVGQHPVVTRADRPLVVAVRGIFQAILIRVVSAQTCAGRHATRMSHLSRSTVDADDRQAWPVVRPKAVSPSPYYEMSVTTRP